MMIASVIICFVLVVALSISVLFNVRHGEIIIDVEDALSEALDVCDQSYARISRVMELPVALATPEVRQVLQEIERVRNSILYVSNVLAEPYGGVIEEDIDDIKS